jgi:transcription elongation factor SPT6
LKQGHRTTQAIFGSDEEEEEDRYAGRNDLSEFIEDDFFSDEDPGEDREVAKPGRKAFSIENLTAGMDEASMEDYHAAFGRGDDYEWALDKEEAEEEQQELDGPKDIQDVFEPGQLAERLLTQADMEIRAIDIPERLQLTRKGISIRDYTDEENRERYKEEAAWIGQLLWPKISHSQEVSQFSHDPEFSDSYNKAILDVITLLNEENYDIPFIYRNRRDYFVYKPPSDMPAARFDIEKSIRILSQSDLWDIAEMDLRYQALGEKRETVRRLYNRLGEELGIKDAVLDEMLSKTASFEEVQDVQEYLYFQYSAQIKDVQVAAANGATRRPKTKDNWDNIRTGPVYHWTRAIGFKTDDFAQHALLGLEESSFQVEDPSQMPDDLADDIAASAGTTSTIVERSAKAIFTEELVTNPRMRKLIRNKIYQYGAIDCFRTEKGKIEITDDHRYFEFKYIRNLDFSSVVPRPEMFLRMLKAEAEGLVEVKIRLLDQGKIIEPLQKMVDSRGTSELAMAWNTIRKDLLPGVVARLEKIIARGVKEALKMECETQLARSCRSKFNDRLDVAPYPLPGEEGSDRPPGEPISVLAMSAGNGVPNRDAICWIYMDVQGKVIDSGKFSDLRARNTEPGKSQSAGADNAKFLSLVTRRLPEVIGISGFSAETRRLFKDVKDILDQRTDEIMARRAANADSEDEDQDRMPQAVYVNDEVARMFHTSDRAAKEFPLLAPVQRYCVALARYLRSPLHEYAALGKSITSISFDSNQDLLPQDKLQRYLEHALMDMVNMVGVDLEEAVNDVYEANLLPYVCGLGLRKATRLLETIQHNVCIICLRLD